MAKTLPIQLVKTRKNQDEFLKEAGGQMISPNGLQNKSFERIQFDLSMR
mgnify:CR=1 FL=1